MSNHFAMKNAYETLNVSPSAGDDEIKKAYLTQVQCFPPDSHPEQFQRIREAYEAISDARARAAYRLFHLPTTDIHSLIAPVFATGSPRRPNAEQLLRCLKASL